MVSTGKFLGKGEKVEIKLGVFDYDLEIDNITIMNTTLYYYYQTYIDIKFEDGKKKEEVEHKLLTFELEGKTQDDKEASIVFNVDTDFDELNKYESNKIIDISDKFHESESFICHPGEKVEFLYFNPATNKEEDMKHELSYLYLYKKGEYDFTFKLVIPHEVFTFFNIKVEK